MNITELLKTNHTPEIKKEDGIQVKTDMLSRIKEGIHQIVLQNVSQKKGVG